MQEQQYPNSKNIHPQVSEKLKRGMTGYQNQNNESKEDEKVTDTEEKKENILHGPDESIFIKNQKISNKESLNQKKYYFQKNITKEQEEAEIKAKKEKEKKEREKSNKEKNKISTQLIPINGNNYIRSENYEKLDYRQLDPTKNEIYAAMTGKYSSLRQGIAYINPKANESHELIEGRSARKVMIDRMKKVYATINIETLLKQADIDFSQVNPLDSWLPLDFLRIKI